MNKVELKKRIQTKAGFTSILSIVIEEAEESLFWLEFILKENLIKKRTL